MLHFVLNIAQSLFVRQEQRSHIRWRAFASAAAQGRSAVHASVESSRTAWTDSSRARTAAQTRRATQQRLSRTLLHARTLRPPSTPSPVSAATSIRISSAASNTSPSHENTLLPQTNPHLYSKWSACHNSQLHPPAVASRAGLASRSPPTRTLPPRASSRPRPCSHPLSPLLLCKPSLLRHAHTSGPIGAQSVDASSATLASRILANCYHRGMSQR